MNIHPNNQLEDIDEINIRNLTFSYPILPNPVLHNINLRIQKGDKLFIVGENGSGKSTLAKIIAGLHEVPEQTCYINNFPIESLRRKDVLDHISIVNQDFVRYPFTIYENITLQSWSQKNEEKVRDLFTKYPELTFNHIDRDLFTLLGLEYMNSRQLSGGQWKKIAIARALFKGASTLVMDEPTSEVDPLTEVSLISNILQHRQDKITVMVTHNVALTTLATQIIVMENGCIVECGSQDTLFKKKGLYWTMWNKEHEMSGRMMGNDEVRFLESI